MIRTERQSIKGEDTMMRTSMNTHLKGMIKGMMALAVAGMLGILSPGPAGAVDLLHNRSRIGAMSFCEPRSWTRVLSS